MISARLEAARVLLSVEQGHTTLGTEIDKARGALDDRRDRGLLVELASGVLRWRNELDALIAAASRRPSSSVEPRARAVLRVGAYQLRHLSRVPDHAVVHESVEVIRALGAPRAAGFVNAVLRALIRRSASIRLPARPDGASDDDPRWLPYLSITLSHPEWLVSRWIARYGSAATERWCQYNNASPLVTVRPLSPLTPADLIEQLRAADIAASPATFVRDAIQLPPGALGRVPAELAGRLLVQDEGSQLVARAAGVRPGERVLDVCASPGGKTVVLATDLGGPSTASALVAADARPGRVALLRSTLDRAALAVPVVRLDASRPLPFGAVFDCVLLDVPCSGLGTLRRDPDLKWTRGADDLPGLAADQRRMLAAAAEAVRPGGRLLYATCSSEPDENQEVVDAFLALDHRFALRALTAGPAIPGQVLNGRGGLETRPDRDGLDAFYAALLVRRAGA